MDSGQCSNTGHNDGTHRLYKATVQGRTHLPCLVLIEAETLAIRSRPHLGPAARQRTPERRSRR